MAAGAVMGDCDVQVLPADVPVMACQGTLIYTDGSAGLSK